MGNVLTGLSEAGNLDPRIGTDAQWLATWHAAETELRLATGRDFASASHTDYDSVMSLESGRYAFYPRNPPVSGVTLSETDTGTVLTPDTAPGDGSGDYYVDPIVNPLDGKSGHRLIVYADYSTLHALTCLYTGGYSEADMPSALKLLVVKAMLILATEQGLAGLDSASEGGIAQQKAVDPWKDWVLEAWAWRRWAV